MSEPIARADHERVEDVLRVEAGEFDLLGCVVLPLRPAYSEIPGSSSISSKSVTGPVRSTTGRAASASSISLGLRDRPRRRCQACVVRSRGPARRAPDADLDVRLGVVRGHHDQRRVIDDTEEGGVDERRAAEQDAVGFEATQNVAQIGCGRSCPSVTLVVLPRRRGCRRDVVHMVVPPVGNSSPMRVAPDGIHLHPITGASQTVTPPISPRDELGGVSLPQDTLTGGEYCPTTDVALDSGLTLTEPAAVPLELGPAFGRWCLCLAGPSTAGSDACRQAVVVPHRRWHRPPVAAGNARK